MRQQINLHQPADSQERGPLSAGSVAIGLGILAACLTALSWYASHSVSNLERAVEQLRVQQNTQQEQLVRSNELTTQRTAPALIDARVQQLGTQLAERQRALDMLQAGAAGQTTGFATRLEALARRHVAGLWLDSVRLSGTNPAMSLQGATTNPDLVPLYLQSLADDPVLAGTRFDQFVIQRPHLAEATTSGGAASSAPATLEREVLRFSAGNTALPPANHEGNQS